MELRELWDQWFGRHTIMYVGWLPGNFEDEKEWRRLGIEGTMLYYADQRLEAYPNCNGYFTQCKIRPVTMKKLLERRLLRNPESFTAYWVETGDNLPRDRQLWGGASVQQ